MKKLVAFDLDGTLAESKRPIEPDMANLLANLLNVVDVAIISGGDWPQFQTQVIERMPQSANLSRLYIMPTTGTKLYRYNQGWQSIYNLTFDADIRRNILTALTAAIHKIHTHDEKIWGEQIEDRGSQITYSGLGQQAPLAAKKAWDPDFIKRKQLQHILQAALPDLSVNIGGSTSIDITQKNVDKASAMKTLEKNSGILTDDMVFLGDAIYPGGNDFSVGEAGIDVIEVRDPNDTRTAIKAIIVCLKP